MALLPTRMLLREIRISIFNTEELKVLNIHYREIKQLI
jgi:hypothetical protein